MVTEDVGNTLRTMEFAPDGKIVVIGDSKGQVHIYELGESLYQPAADEAVKLTRTLKELQQDEP